MICPNCKYDVRFSTIDSRPRSWGIKRVKVCPKCDYHLATIEIYKISDVALESLKLSQELLDYRMKERNYK